LLGDERLHYGPAALAMAHLVGMQVLFDQEASVAKLFDEGASGFHDWHARVARPRVLVHSSVEADDQDHRQVVPLADLEVGGVVAISMNWPSVLGSPSIGASG